MLLQESTLPSSMSNPLCLGHDGAEHSVLEAWNKGRMPHAWLIFGSRGIGKATFACRMARFLLMAEGNDCPADTLDISLDQPKARQMIQGTHPDFHYVQRAWDADKGRFKGDIVIDDARGVSEFLSMTATNGRWRVALIDAADEMNDNAANALLKILEEPPRHSVLILVAHNRQRLAATIRSRCRSLALTAPSEDDALLLIARACPDLARDEARLLLRLGGGSVGRALALAQQDGVKSYNSLIGLLGDLPDLNVPALYALANRFLTSVDALRVGADLLLWCLERTITSGASRDLPIEIVPGENEITRAMLAAAPLDRWCDVWDKSRNLFESAQALHLDGRQTFVTAVGLLRSAMSQY